VTTNGRGHNNGARWGRFARWYQRYGAAIAAVIEYSPSRYRGRMAQSDHEAPQGTAELLAAVGITVTKEGKARARARLDEAAARWTPERWAALREQLGLPARAA
jgi:hypothetical protein